MRLRGIVYLDSLKEGQHAANSQRRRANPPWLSTVCGPKQSLLPSELWIMEIRSLMARALH
jgi:hypothetical protein